jgi:hypothetical protein
MKKIFFPLAAVVLISCSKSDMPKPKYLEGSKHRCPKQDESIKQDSETSTNVENGKIRIIHNFGGGGCGCGVTHNPPPRPVLNNQVKED